MSKKLTLSDLIDALPTPDVKSGDLKSLILQLILDTPDDDPRNHFANRSKVKLEALKLLSDINRNDSVSDYEADLLDILGEKEDE
mgnify:CR=1 FL=1|jgi:hypothetical protein|tara:strand:+ start:115 stop:369 length:255 start_codon:yes stop_codon:yes gene_type:complete